MKWKVKLKLKVKLGQFKILKEQANQARNLGKIGKLGWEILFKKTSNGCQDYVNYLFRNMKCKEKIWLQQFQISHSY